MHKVCALPMVQSVGRASHEHSRRTEMKVSARGGSWVVVSWLLGCIDIVDGRSHLRHNQCDTQGFHDGFSEVELGLISLPDEGAEGSGVA